VSRRQAVAFLDRAQREGLEAKSGRSCRSSAGVRPGGRFPAAIFLGLVRPVQTVLLVVTLAVLFFSKLPLQTGVETLAP